MYKAYNLEGLSQDVAKKNLEIYGKNILPEANKNNPILLFVKQFASPFIYILLAVSLLSFISGETTDTFVILAILIVNSIIGTLQEYKANNAIKALKKLSHTKSRALRGTTLLHIKTEDLTIDDIIFLESGDLIPADGELIESHMLMVNESQLTGESLPIEKKLKDTLYRGSVIVSGNAFMRIKNIGKYTFIGTIAKDISKNADKKSELSKKLSSFSLYLLIILLFVIILFLLFSISTGVNVSTAIKTSIAIGVAVIPEGLPVVLTVVLSLGALHISRARALLRNLQSGSTLASVSFICTDKTGTLTYGDLSVKEIVNINKNNLPEEIWNNYLYHSIDIKNINGEKVGDVLDLVLEKNLQGSFIYKEIKELPFTSEAKYNAKEYQIDDSFIQIYKGSPEALGVHEAIIAPYTKKGFRVLVVGYKKLSASSEFMTQNISPIGIVVFEDKIRAEVKQSISECKQAGISLLVITGDNILTGEYVAKEVGIMNHKDDISITGDILDTLHDEELKEKIYTIKVIARASPMHKERIVTILQELGEVVAMTGDGVNDGPALSLANIGISMGKSGTEVAREASDLVLLDDNFSDIALAIFEARTISENIRKTLVFLMTSSLGIVVALLGSLALSIPLPFLAIQILWLNFVTAGLLDVSIATEEPEIIFKSYNFKRYSGFLLNMYDIMKILVIGTFIGSVSLFGFSLFTEHYSLPEARTATLLLISAFVWFNAFNVRKNYETIFSFSLFSNRFILGAIAVEAILLLGSFYHFLGNSFLHTIPINYPLMILIIVSALSIFLVDALFKTLYKRRF